jgi:hypothetical protein
LKLELHDLHTSYFTQIEAFGLKLHRLIHTIQTTLFDLDSFLDGRELQPEARYDFRHLNPRCLGGQGFPVIETLPEPPAAGKLPRHVEGRPEPEVSHRVGLVLE